MTHPEPTHGVRRCELCDVTEHVPHVWTPTLREPDDYHIVYIGDVWYQCPGWAAVDERCPLCDHPRDDHAMVPTQAEFPAMGGIMLCPVVGCECYSTWDVPPFSSRESVYEPPPEVVKEIRQAIQEQGK